MKIKFLIVAVALFIAGCCNVQPKDESCPKKTLTIKYYKDAEVVTEVYPNICSYQIRTHLGISSLTVSNDLTSFKVREITSEFEVVSFE